MKQILSEIRLKRIIGYFNSNIPFGIVSAFRDLDVDGTPLSLKENTRRHDELKSKVRGLGYGYVEVIGSYREEGRPEFKEERALLIPKITLDEVLKLGNNYSQDSVIHKGDGEFALYKCIDGSIITRYKEGFSEEDVKNEFSRLLKGSHSKRKFVFTSLTESVDPPANNFMTRAYLRKGK